ncbi:MAG TPA: hypothetical protein VIV60_31810 [Polyangiaceae bacterium]
MPSRFRTLETVTLRYAAWDLTTVELVDPHTHVPLATLLPLDKQRNAESGRRALENIEVEASSQSHRAVGVAPLLQKHIEQQQALGTPPEPHQPKPNPTYTHHRRVAANAGQCVF